MVRIAASINTLLLVVAGRTRTVQGQSEAAFVPSSGHCPDYRYFDAEAPNKQFLGAPDGCACYDGLSGLNCGYCQDDAPCQQHDPTYTCRQGLLFEPGDTHKGYYCRLGSLWNAVYGNGQLSIYFDAATQSGNLTLYQFQTIDGYPRALDCAMEDCDFEVGKTTATCQSVTCSCEQQCQNRFLDVYKQMVLDINNSRAVVEIGEPADSGHNISGQHALKVRMEGANMDLVFDAFCTGSTCQPPAPVDNTFGMNDMLPEASDAELSQSSASSHTGFLALLLPVVLSASAFVMV